ncbi:MAG: hypothetical protein H0V17_03670 [Deltaproteobacteria bacterium]|nr:hypothetical protein [Deltaproteobacteria bacterium]
MRALGCLVVLCLASTATADPVGERVAAGEELAKQARWTEAIESFKAADKIEKRAKHACLIALAYVRRELWPQAEVFLTLCHERATASDRVPDWVQLAEQQLKEKLAKAKVAVVHIRVVPAEIASQTSIGVSAFEPDELFAPRTIHLGHGKHLITAKAPGRETRQQTIEIVDDSPREVMVDFDAKAPEVIPAAAKPVAKGPSKIPLIVTSVGGALVFAGAGYHLFAFKSTRDDLAAAPDDAAYTALEGKFDSQKRNTIILYSVGAAVVVTGLVLGYRMRKSERKPSVGAMVAPGGAMVVMEWNR